MTKKKWREELERREIEKQERIFRGHQRDARRRDAYKPVKRFLAIGNDVFSPPAVTTLFVGGRAKSN